MRRAGQGVQQQRAPGMARIIDDLFFVVVGESVGGGLGGGCADLAFQGLEGEGELVNCAVVDLHVGRIARDQPAGGLDPVGQKIARARPAS